MDDKPIKSPTATLGERIQSSTQQVRGSKTAGHDALLFLNTRYESFPVAIQQETLISSNAKSIYNNLWIWAKTKQSTATPASLFPGYDWIGRATGLERATIASGLTQLRLQRYLTLHNKVRSESGQFVGNDYILNDEPMPLSDTFTWDIDYINFVRKNLSHRHQRVQHLSVMALNSINSHIQHTDDPFRPSSHMEKVEARQQADQIIQARLFPEEQPSELPEPKQYYGIPIDEYNAMINQVHKVNAVENDENAQVHKVNTVMNADKLAENTQVHKVNAVETPSDQRVHKMNLAVNEEMNGCSRGYLYNTTTTETEFTEEAQNFIPQEPIELIFPDFDSPNELAICELHIRKLAPEHQQPMLDELAGRMKATNLPKLDNPIGYLKGWLIKQLEAGAIPYTSSGSQHAARRDPSLKKDQKPNADQRQLIRDLKSEIEHLNRMIEFDQQQKGVNAAELIHQRDIKQLELEKLEQRRIG